ncbi:MAG: glutamyl-tRNA reductase [Candidatus Omnitrophica bacterium]|nr:glutamyl-tRNA reductase [Candidatus Omnitrophota bacterium]
MPLVLVGVNHKTCPLEVREKFFIQSVEKDLLLAEFRNDPRVLAAIVLSTCNRTEIYADLLTADPAIILDRFLSVKGLSLSAGLADYFYVRTEQQMVDHLFRVVNGLDSMILGEKQILGQVKCAVSWSQQKQMMNRTFNILANLAIETGKKVRRDTLIDFGGSSISWAAVTEAQNILGTLEGKTVLVLGSGKMGFLAVQELKNKGVGKIFIMNRTFDKAEELASQCGAEAVMFWQIKEVLEESDVCICSTGAPHYLVDKALMQQVMAARPNRRFAAIDIAVPRNIDPHASLVPGVTLVSVDGLSQTVLDTKAKRLAAVEQAEQIIAIKINEFYKTLDKAAAFDSLNITRLTSEAYSE